MLSASSCGQALSTLAFPRQMEQKFRFRSHAWLQHMETRLPTAGEDSAHNTAALLKGSPLRFKTRLIDAQSSRQFSHNANQVKQEDLLSTVLVDILVLFYLVFNQAYEMNPQHPHFTYQNTATQWGLKVTPSRQVVNLTLEMRAIWSPSLTLHSYSTSMKSLLDAIF